MFFKLLYSVSENDFSDRFTSEICKVVMLVTLKGKNSDLFFFSNYCTVSQKMILMTSSPQKFAWSSYL